ncbi:glycine dehydrogenase (aminomethyl-transferring) [Sulfolobus sp. A20]|uniref:aminomethyl-transferring glycine dehydrogenase subunit GcvPA n=1 Tax=Saccharolobus sp. A20 TaxID=1891280 RepID=UPI0008461C13|nr:aminomethyl-transferring glycine dehydrogenase subunit GcvPA [Sulfolobus sp. A20]AOL15712.1 glycine dehydrogenase (aminomethyl-transferring) [Sulfolobus sp. A20]TRM80617.1 aminomethyl-transferring glycine dehydrogenase subunit GcvPA [Sulfolobus sp. D5]TRM94456.1 aminomethyl-transferring glycine dehydrogenase subunit GcvPA [Sulfolobus sp. A20-N-G8]TRM99939.1 aminomethyl-transferring glycine dehydrogenase subunit GcvPA [Sulfolobus sp. F1]
MDKHPWLPNLSSVEDMLKEIGINNIDELFRDIPEELKLKRLLNVGKGKPLSEYEILEEINKKANRNVDLAAPPFIGGGICPHYVPYAVKFITSRSEFYTAYTPYQPEISQGLLQALFEYQSLMAELLEMEVVNSSMYDWGSALAEAVLMANRVNGKKTVLVPENSNPFHKEVLNTWIQGKDLKVVEVKYDRQKGEIDINDLEKKFNDDVTAVYVQQPNFFGVFEENIEHIVDLAKHKKAISIMGVNPLSLGLIKPPGQYDIDVAVGDGQELGLSMNFGGPLMGIFAVRWDASLVRQMPGRIVGITRDSEGNRGYTLILQTREQFIKREKATSNITTNEGLMAIANAVYLSLLGKDGIRELAEEIYYRSHYAMKKLTQISGITRAFKSDFFEEFVLKFPTKYDIIKEMLKRHKIQGGLKISENTALFCFTEVHNKQSIDTLASVLAEAIGNVETS